MILYGLRLLVALLTFAFGVAAAWVFSSSPSKNCKTVAVLREGPVVERVNEERAACRPPRASGRRAPWNPFS